MSIFWILVGFVACMAVESVTPSSYWWLKDRVRAAWMKVKEWFGRANA